MRACPERLALTPHMELRPRGGGATAEENGLEMSSQLDRSVQLEITR